MKFEVIYKYEGQHYIKNLEHCSTYEQAQDLFKRMCPNSELVRLRQLD